MARVQARSNIYTALPILATLIMAGGIAVTWLYGINPYKKPPKPTILPPIKGRQNPDIARPEAPKAPPVDEGLLPKAPDEKAPSEEPGEPTPEVKAPDEKAPDVKAPEEKAPDEKAPEVKAPEEKAPDDTPPAEKEPPVIKAEEEEK